MINDVKKLRNETGAGVMDVQRALKEAGGDFAHREEQRQCTWTLWEATKEAMQVKGGRESGEDMPEWG